MNIAMAGSITSAFERLLHLFVLFEDQTSQRSLSRPRLRELLQLADLLLKSASLQGSSEPPLIQSAKSHLQLLESRILDQLGNRFSAVAATTGSDDFRHLLQLAAMALSDANVSLAMHYLTAANQLVEDENQNTELVIKIARAHYLSGEVQQALRELQEHSDPGPEIAPEVREEILWLIEWIKAVAEKRPVALKRLGKLVSPEQPNWIMQTILLYYCRGQKKYRQNLPQADSIRRRFPDFSKSSPANSTWFALFRDIDLLLSDGTKPNEAIGKAAAILDRIPRLEDPEQKLLAFAVIAKFLRQSSDLEFSHYVNATYVRYSQILTGQVDFFQISEPRPDLRSGERLLRKITPWRKQYPFAAKFNLMTTVRSAVHLKNLISARRLSTSDQGRVQVNKAIDYFVSRGKVERGVIAKFVQTFGYYNFDILADMWTPDADVIAVDVEPMNRGEVEKVMAKELGPQWEKEFAAFDYLNPKTGSMGQVHLGILKDGREVAVKVQYPDVKEMGQLLLHRADHLRKFASVFLPHYNFKVIFQGFQRQFHNETNFLEEAKNINRYRNISNELPLLALPEVCGALTTAKVLTTTYLGGSHINEFCQDTQSASIRGNFAEQLALFIYQTTYQHGLINVDFNADNFLFAKDRIGYVDFGAVFEIPDWYQKARIEAHLGYLLGDESRFHQGVQDMKIFNAMDTKTFAMAEQLWDLMFCHAKPGYCLNGQESQKILQLVTSTPFLTAARACEPGVMSLRMELGLFPLLFKLCPTGRYQETVFQGLGLTAPSTHQKSS